MKEPKKRAPSVCPHCGAGRGRGVAYFIVACVLIVFGVLLVGHYLVNVYTLLPVLKEFEEEMKQPFPRDPVDEILAEPAERADEEALRQ
ncbi:MAG: hypothetical protein ABIP48_17120 [Planctomycetota bacterium]